MFLFLGLLGTLGIGFYFLNKKEKNNLSFDNFLSNPFSAIFPIISNNNTLYNFDFNYFKNVLGLSESSNNYSEQSNGIAFGRFQFIPTTIDRISKELMIETPTIQQFLDNHNLQDTFYSYYVNEILEYIQKNNLDVYIGQYYTGKGNGITKQADIYGLVAGAWLSGRGGLYNFLVNGIDKSDGNTYISDYIVKFS